MTSLIIVTPYSTAIWQIQMRHRRAHLATKPAEDSVATCTHVGKNKMDPKMTAAAHIKLQLHGTIRTGNAKSEKCFRPKIFARSTLHDPANIARDLLSKNCVPGKWSKNLYIGLACRLLHVRLLLCQIPSIEPEIHVINCWYNRKTTKNQIVARLLQFPKLLVIRHIDATKWNCMFN